MLLNTLCGSVPFDERGKHRKGAPYHLPYPDPREVQQLATGLHGKMQCGVTVRHVSVGQNCGSIARDTEGESEAGSWS